jgi:hypothetical protein
MATAEALWLRAVRAADARGLLPTMRSRLTPAELAAEVARRGENRLVRLVHGWYYPRSYGRVSGALSDEEAARLVTELEAEIVQTKPAATSTTPATEVRPIPGPMRCDLCRAPLRR